MLEHRSVRGAQPARAREEGVDCAGGQEGFAQGRQ